jgi:hypothetical protein
MSREAEGPDNSRAVAIVEAVHYLLGALKMLRVLHEMTPDNGRAWAQATLEFVTEFIVKIDPVEGASDCGALRLVQEALTELKFGRAIPLVVPEKYGAGRQKDRIAQVALKGIAAADVSALMELGFGREEAAKKVAAELNRNNVKIASRQGLTWKTVAQWRDEIRSQKQAHPAFRYYERVRELNRTMFLNGPSDHASRAKSATALMSKLGEMIIKFRMVDS